MCECSRCHWPIKHDWCDCTACSKDSSNTYFPSKEDVKKFRDAVDYGIMDCKKALETCNGNIEKAKEWLNINRGLFPPNLPK